MPEKDVRELVNQGGALDSWFSLTLVSDIEDEPKMVLHVRALDDSGSTVFSACVTTKPLSNVNRVDIGTDVAGAVDESAHDGRRVDVPFCHCGKGWCLLENFTIEIRDWLGVTELVDRDDWGERLEDQHGWHVGLWLPSVLLPLAKTEHRAGTRPLLLYKEGVKR